LNKDWLLTESAFSRLLAHFDADPERAAENYERTRAQLIRLFRYRGCNSNQDLADEVLNRVARKLDKGEIVHRAELTNYFYGVARNVLREYLRNPATLTSPLDGLSHSSHLSEDPQELMERDEAQQRSELRFRCLDECLLALAPEARLLIVSYYEGKEGAKIENRRRLARELGVSLNSLRINVHRTRERLERCVTLCLNGGARNR